MGAQVRREEAEKLLSAERLHPDGKLPGGLPEPFAPGLSSAMAAAAAAVQSGDASALRALREKLAQVEEENRRLRAARGARRATGGDDEEEEDSQEAIDRRTWAAYELAREDVMQALARGVAPSAQQYQVRRACSRLRLRRRGALPSPRVGPRADLASDLALTSRQPSCDHA